MSDKTTEETYDQLKERLATITDPTEREATEFSELNFNTNLDTPLIAAYEGVLHGSHWKDKQLSTTISQLREENERYQWVSVEDKLPEDGEKVLCINEVGYMKVGAMFHEHKYFSGDDGYNFIKYWMPLPSPPTEALTPKPPKTNG